MTPITLGLAIALGIAFGVALIPAARWGVGTGTRWAGGISRRHVISVAGILLVAAISLAWAQQRQRSSPPPANVDGIRLGRNPIDSARACTDSALLAQRREEDSATKQAIADRIEPSQKAGDSAWLAWKHRKDARSTSTMDLRAALPRTCGDFSTQ